jgi:hypothetical protein
MKNVTVFTVASEILTYARVDISELKGDLSLFLGSGEDVLAIKGPKLYFDDILIGREDNAALAIYGDDGAFVSGQYQQTPLYSELSHPASLLEPAAVIVASTCSVGFNPDCAIKKAASNKVAAVATIIFNPILADALLPLSGYKASAFTRTQINPINKIVHFDAINQLNVRVSANDVMFVLTDISAAA